MRSQAEVMQTGFVAMPSCEAPAPVLGDKRASNAPHPSVAFMITHPKSGKASRPILEFCLSGTDR